MAKLVPKRKLRSQGPPSPIVKENAVPEDEGSIPEVILAADESDSDPEISTDGEESGEDDDGESMDDKEEDGEELGSDDEEDGDSQGLVSIYIFCFIRLLWFCGNGSVGWYVIWPHTELHINWDGFSCNRSEYSSGDEGDESSGDDEAIDEEARNYVLDVMKDYLGSAGPRDVEEAVEHEDQGNGAGEANGQSGNPTTAEESDSSEDEVRILNCSLRSSCFMKRVFTLHCSEPELEALAVHHTF